MGTVSEKFPTMRRKDRALSEEAAVQILKEGEYGILATCGEDGQPYGVPLSYVYHDVVTIRWKEKQKVCYA